MTTIYYDPRDPTSPTYRKSPVERELMHQSEEDILYTDFTPVELHFPNWHRVEHVIKTALYDNIEITMGNSGIRYSVHFINSERLFNLCPAEYQSELEQLLSDTTHKFGLQWNDYVKEHDTKVLDPTEVKYLIWTGDRNRELTRRPTMMQTIKHELGLVEYVSMNTRILYPHRTLTRGRRDACA